MAKKSMLPRHTSKMSYVRRKSKNSRTATPIKIVTSIPNIAKVGLIKRSHSYTLVWTSISPGNSLRVREHMLEAKKSLSNKKYKININEDMHTLTISLAEPREMNNQIRKRFLGRHPHTAYRTFNNIDDKDLEDWIEEILNPSDDNEDKDENQGSRHG